MKKRKARRAHARKRHSYATNPSSHKRRRRRRRSPMVALKAHRRRRSYRKNPGDSIKDIAILVGTGLAGAIAGPKIASKLPGSILVKNIAMIAAGAALAVLGRRKNYLVGLGAGLVVAGATRALTNAVPQLAGDNEFNGEEQAAILQHLAGEELSGPLDGEELSGPLDGEDNFFNGEELSGPLDGEELSGPLDGEELLGSEFNNATL